MRVLGIDPGSETLGWGVVEGSGLKYSLVDFGTVKSSPREAFSKRLAKIYYGVAEVTEKFGPDVLSIEEAFYATNVSVAMKLGQVRGVVLLLAEQREFADRRICSAADQADGRRLRQCGKASGAGDGADTAANEIRPDAARRRRRPRHRDLPLPPRRTAGPYR